MKWPYTANVQARLIYLSLVWGPSLRHKGIRDKIDSINKLAVDILSNMCRSTLSLGLEVMYNLPPNNILLIKEGVLSLARNRYILYSNWVVNSKAVNLIGHVKY